MTETERNQIKDALFKWVEENENRSTFTGHIVVSSLCRSAVERIEELEKENAELDCQMNRNKYCYSCANVTDRCFRKEIGCPCEKYKSYKDENAELTKAIPNNEEVFAKVQTEEQRNFLLEKLNNKYVRHLRSKL